ncbi:MAG: YHS domain-containing protein [Candidatus Omnitrophica bacterium]|nr:YHS domain-containing protein [Candidatus Omnitrophota bacterium]
MFRKISLILIVSLFVFGMSKLSFAMMCGEHSGSQQLAQVHSGHEHGAAEATEDTATKESVNVGNKICPVSGEKIDEKLKVTYEYEGKVYNFCCSGCISEFKKDPDKYIKKVNEELQAKP